MSKFALTAQLQLRAPTNTGQVVSQLRRELKKGATIDLKVTGYKKAQAQISSVTKETKKAKLETNQLAKAISGAAKRYLAFAAAGRGIALVSKLGNAIDEAIKFETELTKISQVTGKTVSQLSGLEKTVTRLSTSLGVASGELIGVSRILSQAGIRGRDLETVLSALAKTTLAATFDDISKTAEGVVAIMSQFKSTGAEVQQQLGAINAVAGQFAVESGDLIDAVRRFGGVFRTAGGELDEFIALFTSVRATTRESAESIATGLRTIFTRIQRPKTIAFLKDLGVELTNVEGQFVGPYEAVRQLNKAFADLPAGSTQFVQIAEELGGFRQIGKVIPLIQQFETAERARQAALAGGDSLSASAAKQQQTLAVAMAKTKEEFLALTRAFVADDAFQAFIRSGLALASALIKVADAIRPLIPLLAALAIPRGLMMLPGLGRGIAGGLGVTRKNTGGKILGFNRGGFVPGAGNRDTVPAMLTPGEFVIKKSSAQKLGAGTLQAMNQNRFAAGGIVDKYKNVGVIGFVPGKNGIIDAGGKASPGTAGSRKSGSDVIGSLIGNTNLDGNQSGLKDLFGATGSKKVNQLPQNLTGKYGSAKNWGQAAEALVRKLGFGGFTSGKAGIKTQGFGRTIPDPDQSETTLEQDIISTTTDQIRTAIGTVGRRIAKTVGVKNIKAKKAPQSIIDQIGIDSIAGKIFEGGITVIDGKPFDEKTSANLAPFDFPTGIGAARGTIESLAKLEGIATDAKKTVSPSIVKDVATKKINNAIAQEILNDKEFSTLRSQFENRKATQRRNKGGSIDGSGDTVPALLTPGEFVINKSAAQSIGYGNLNSMNKTGVARFNKGGPVPGVQYLNEGGKAGGAGLVTAGALALPIAFTAINSAIDKFAKTADDATLSVKKANLARDEFGTNMKAVTTGILQFGILAAAVYKAYTAITKWQKATEDSTDKTKEDGGGESKDKGAESSKDSKDKKKEGRQEKQQKKTGEKDTKRKAKAKGPIDDLKALIATQKKYKDEITNLTSTVRQNIADKKRLVEINNKTSVLTKKEINEKTDLTRKNNQHKEDMQKLRKEYGVTGNSVKAGIAVQKRWKVELDLATREVNKSAKSIKKNFKTLTFEGDTLAQRIKSSARTYNQLSKTIDNTSTRQDKFTRTLRKMRTPLRYAEGGFQQLQKEIKRAGRTARQSFGVGGRGRKFAGRAGRFAVGAAGLAGTAAIIGSQISQAIATNANRRRDIAVASGNASEAIKQGGVGARAEEVGKLFSIGGIIGAALDPEGFAKGIKSAIANASIDAGISASQTSIDLELNRRKKNKTAGSTTGLDAFVSNIGGNLQESAAEIEKQFAKGAISNEEREAKLNKLAETANKAAVEVGNSAQSSEDLEAKVRKLSGSDEELYQANLRAAKSAFDLAAAQRVTAKAQFESLQLSSSFKAASIAVNQFLGQIESGADPLAGFIASVEAGAGAIGVDNTNAINQLEQDLLDQVGGTGLEGAVKRQADTARAANDFSLSVGKKLSDLDLNIDPGKREAQIRSALLQGVGNDEAGQAIKSQINAALAGADFANLNLSEIIKKVQTNVSGLSQGLIQSAKLQAEHNATMTGLYKKREALENKAAQAQIKAIDTQLKAAKIFEEAGGDSLTLGQKSSARVAQFNQLGSLAGVNLQSGSASDIRAVSEQIRSSFLNQQQADITSQQVIAQGKRGAFAGPEGVGADTRPELVAAQKQLLQTTQQQIAIRKEELNIIKQKNAAEKSALDKLLSGDVAGFIEQQEAAGAAAALETGDKGLASLFDTRALGAGFKELEKRGGATQAAAEAALSGFGLSGTGAAGVLSGTTPEEQALNAEIRNLAVVMGDLAQNQAEFEKSNLDINKATITITEAKFNQTLSQTAGNVQGKWMGGTIYASQGAFIPRGTDTVPAMLTPGEFVVNRRAVQSGNNLQVLKAMNSGAGSGASGQGGLNGGGQVGYYQFGGIVEAITSAFGGGVTNLLSAFGNFNQAVEKLANLELTLNIPDTNIRVSVDAINISSLREQVVDQVMDKVAAQIGNTKQTNTGETTTNSSVVPPIGNG